MAAAVPTCERAARATSTYPACAIELYPNRRLMFDCVSAAKLPMVIDSSADPHTSGYQSRAIGSKAVMKMRRNMAKAAALGPVVRNAETGVGAPSSLSGLGNAIVSDKLNSRAAGASETHGYPFCSD